MPATFKSTTTLPVLFTSAPEPVPGLLVCAIVPVRNEAETLLETLDALRIQINGEHDSLDTNIYEVLVLINNCTDDSYTIAEQYQRQHPGFRLYIDEIQLPEPQANIGTVRRILMDTAFDRLSKVNPGSGIIASTDGDTMVDNQWIHYILTEIEGNDAVGGRILTKSERGITRGHHLRNVTYRCLLAHAEAILDPQKHDPMPRHFQYFGASLAVTCAMYEQAGRLPQVPCLEDMAFGKALERQDARIRKSFKVKVYTSFRLQGRVAIGFSEQLQKWTNDHQANIEQTVEPVDYSLFLFATRNRLHQCWAAKREGSSTAREINAIARLLNLNNAEFNQLLTAPYFGEFWAVAEQQLQPYREDYAEAQLITDAIAQLRTFINAHEPAAAPVDPCDNWLHAGERAA